MWTMGISLVVTLIYFISVYLKLSSLHETLWLQHDEHFGLSIPEETMGSL